MDAGRTVSAGYPDTLPITGERTVPGIAAENYWYLRHEAAYQAITGLLPTGRVLEAGVGEGYGAALLARGDRHVVGLDYDATTVEHVHRRYPAVPVLRGNAVGLPFATGCFDAVVSMQLIEHLWDQPRHVAECARVLRPGGTLVVTTPNRYTFSPGYDPAVDRPRNIYHTRELAAAELAALLAPVEGTHTVYGLQAGARLRAVDARCRSRFGTSLMEAQLALPAADWPAELTAMVTAVRVSDFELLTTDIDSALDLVVVTTRA